MGRPKVITPIGARFGKLEVVGPYGNLSGHTSVVCRCDCGNLKEISCSNLRHKQSTSCGCKTVRARYHNLVGTVFGKLTILDDSLHSKTHRIAKCLCACGNETCQPLHAVVDGRVVSCGCHSRGLLGERSFKHGEARRDAVSVEFKTWAGMKKRCENPQATFYSHYGGRGIGVCDRWQEFSNFLSDMGKRPSPNHSLDRIDTNCNYEPENCRWATNIEQANNRRITPMVEYKGRTQSIADWARELGFRYWSLRNRLVNLGWSVDRALTTPAVLGRNQFS